MMPGMDGWEVCRKIKNDPKRKSITVIIFSVLSDPEDKEKSLEYARADGHLSKDLGFKDVAALVDNLLKRRLPPERLRAISRMNDKVKLI
jgi:two-component system cell cycle response regulator